MDFKKYQNKMRYPARPVKPYLSRDASIDDAKAHVTALEHYEEQRDKWEILRIEAEREDSRLARLFKADLFEDLGITGNPKAEKLYTLAWEYGHSGGFSEIYSYAYNFASLII